MPFDVDWSPYGFAGVTRSYDGFWDAADEQARSRVYGGIHFTFDSEAGQQIGADVAGYVTDNFLTPRDNNSSFRSDPLPATSATARGIGGGIYNLLLSDVDKFDVI